MFDLTSELGCFKSLLEYWNCFLFQRARSVSDAHSASARQKAAVQMMREDSDSDDE